MPARIYVGTYAKYNAGSIAGAWINLEGHDKDSFAAACRELHQNESDPELMFQDYEGFPKEFYHESHISDSLFDWLELGGDDRELLAVYVDSVNSDGDIGQARDSFEGKADSEADWAAEHLESTGGLDGVPEHLKNYIDFESFARDARLGGGISFIRHNGELWAFNTNV